MYSKTLSCVFHWIASPTLTQAADPTEQAARFAPILDLLDLVSALRRDPGPGPQPLNGDPPDPSSFATFNYLKSVRKQGSGPARDEYFSDFPGTGFIEQKEMGERRGSAPRILRWGLPPKIKDPVPGGPRPDDATGAPPHNTARRSRQRGCRGSRRHRTRRGACDAPVGTTRIVAPASRDDHRRR